MEDGNTARIISRNYVMSPSVRRMVSWLLGIFLVMLVLANGYFWKNDLIKIFMIEDRYEITNVPYIGLHNNQDFYRQPYAFCDTSSSIAAVLEYWYPGVNNLDDLYNQYPHCITYDIDAVQEYIGSIATTLGQKYNATTAILSLDEVSLYLNEKTQTPLIAFLPISTDQPSDLTYYPAVVITGIDNNTKELTISSYWSGPSRVFTFAEFQALQSILPAEKQNTFLIVQPVTLEEYNFDFVRNFNPNPAQIPILSREELDLFSAMAAAEGAYNLEMFDLAKLNFLRFVENPLFTTAVPPIMRVWELNRFADAVGNGLGEYDEALEILERADALNSELGKPFRYFEGYEYLLNNNNEGGRDRLSVVYITKGDMYRKLGDTQKAIESYQKALQIYSGHRGPLEILNELLAENDTES